MMIGFGFLGTLVFGVVLLALLIGGLVPVLRQIGDTPSSEGQHPPIARQVLDERFARGEIGSEEYEMIRAQIES